MRTMEGPGSGGGVVVTSVIRPLPTMVNLAQDPLGDGFLFQRGSAASSDRAGWFLGSRHQPPAPGPAVMGDVRVA